MVYSTSSLPHKVLSAHDREGSVLEDLYLGVPLDHLCELGSVPSGPYDVVVYPVVVAPSWLAHQ